LLTGKFLKCKDGYYYNTANTCTKCGDNVATCTFSSPTVKVTTCDAGFGGASDCLTACIVGGLTCDGTANKAKTCKDGFYIITDGTTNNCRSCGKNV